MKKLAIPRRVLKLKRTAQAFGESQAGVATVQQALVITAFDVHSNFAEQAGQV